MGATNRVECRPVSSLFAPRARSRDASLHSAATKMQLRGVNDTSRRTGRLRYRSAPQSPHDAQRSGNAAFGASKAAGFRSPPAPGARRAAGGGRARSNAITLLRAGARVHAREGRQQSRRRGLHTVGTINAARDLFGLGRADRHAPRTAPRRGWGLGGGQCPSRRGSFRRSGSKKDRSV